MVLNKSYFWKNTDTAFDKYLEFSELLTGYGLSCTATADSSGYFVSIKDQYIDPKLGVSLLKRLSHYE